MYVKKNPGAGEYLTVASALAAITTNAAANPFLIKIGAGVFVEAPMTLKPYVFLEGTGYATTIIYASAVTDTVMTATDRCAVSNLQINGATSGKGIYHVNSSGMSVFAVFNCSFGNCAICVHTHGATARTLTLISNCKLGGPFNFTTGFQVTNAGFETQLAIVDSQFRDDVAPYPTVIGSAAGAHHTSGTPVTTKRWIRSDDVYSW